MPAFIQTALADGHYFTDSLSNDFIIRTQDSSESILIGLGSNSQSKVRITSNEVFFNSRFRIDELIFDAINTEQRRNMQPHILYLGPDCNLVIDSNNFQVRINASNNEFIETDPTYQLYVNSNIYSHNLFAEHSIQTSNLICTG